MEPTTSTTLGTKADPLGGPVTSTGNPGGLPILQLTIAIFVVMAIIKWVLPKILGKVNKRIVTGIGSQIRVEESAAFAGGNLYIVQAKGKSLLLSVNQSGVQCLADITEAPAPELLQKEVPQAFQALVEAAPAVPNFVKESVQPSADDVQRVLDRLGRLGAV